MSFLLVDFLVVSFWRCFLFLGFFLLPKYLCVLINYTCWESDFTVLRNFWQFYKTSLEICLIYFRDCMRFVCSSEFAQTALPFLPPIILYFCLSAHPKSNLTWPCSSNFTITFLCKIMVKNKVTFGQSMILPNGNSKWGFKIVVEDCGQKSLFQVFPVIVWLNIYEFFILFFLRVTKLWICDERLDGFMNKC